MIHSFLMIGQSNMAGRGFIKEAREIDQTNILVLINGRFKPMVRPVNYDGGGPAVSLAESFAEKYVKQFGVEVGLIGCAEGGTRLDMWAKGGGLYENAVAQAKLAQRVSEIKGILWHQGEGDIGYSLYGTYKERFEVFMKSLRDDLNLPDVPWLIGGLGDFIPDIDPKDDHLKLYAKLNEQFEKIAEENEYIGYVPAHGLGANPDNLHFNSEALYEFGHRYFDEFVKLQNRYNKK